MQKVINNIFCEVKDYGCVYIDKIICIGKFLNNLFFKLRILFQIFVAYRILIKLTNLFLNYLDMGLFEQYINFLDLTTIIKKL